MSDWYRWDEDDLVLTLRLQPRAPNDQWALDGTQLKVRITTPPIDGLANQHLLKFAAASFGGEHGPHSSDARHVCCEKCALRFTAHQRARAGR